MRSRLPILGRAVLLPDIRVSVWFALAGFGPLCALVVSRLVRVTAPVGLFIDTLCVPITARPKLTGETPVIPTRL